jgi:hypothetical protein
LIHLLPLLIQTILVGLVGFLLLFDQTVLLGFQNMDDVVLRAADGIA